MIARRYGASRTPVDTRATPRKLLASNTMRGACCRGGELPSDEALAATGSFECASTAGFEINGILALPPTLHYGRDGTAAP